jgi:hypothetical protein
MKKGAVPTAPFPFTHFLIHSFTHCLMLIALAATNAVVQAD